MNIEDFLEILEQRDLVPSAIVKQVRRKVEQGDRRITPKSLLKYLVKKELVTKRQAKQLLETTLTVTPNAESSILGMVPMPKAPKPDKSLKKPKTDDEIPTITPVDEAAQTAKDDDGLVTDSGTAAEDLSSDKPPSLLSESLSKIGLGDPTLSEAMQETSLDSDQPSGGKSKRKKKKKDEWDSSLLLLGGGGLALLIVTGVIIGILLMREDADAILAKAGEDFEGGSYTQAIKQYERFVENHPGHPEFSAGKVKLGMARLRKSTSGSTSFSAALTTAKQVLADIEDEEEFTIAKPDLAVQLQAIAQGLANRAEKATEEEKIKTLVSEANVALSLYKNTKYIPKAYRDEVVLDEIGQTLDRVERAQQQNIGLAKALAEMQEAIKNRDTVQAYQTHDSLLDEHPGLINNEQLAAMVLEISTAESAVVKYVAETQAASTEPRPSKIIAELALANRIGDAASGPEGVVAVRISGAVYGLNTKDGSLLWRQFVGIAPHGTPVQLDSGDLLVIDAQHHELLKLSAKTGKMQWRQPFETPIVEPVLLGDKILVTETSGKLHVVDSMSGQRDGYVQFAQQIATPPTVGAQGRRIYLAGEHSSLYTLSAEDFSCLGVFFLNHAKGSVTTPPVNVLNKVVVAVAKGVSTSRLEVLSTTDDGIPNQRATSRRLTGLVNTALLVEGRRLVTLTSQGQVMVYEIGSGTGKGSLTQIASREAESGTPMARFGMLNKGHVWVAGPKLSKLAILPTSDRLPVSNIDQDYLGDTFDHPLQKSGQLLIHVRHPAGKAGAKVAAMTLKTGQPRWEIELATPPSGAPTIDATSMRIGSVSSSGSAYLVDREAMSRRVLNEAKQLRTRRNMPPLNQSLDLGAGRLVASADGANVLLHFQPGGMLKALTLAGPASCAPVVWDQGFVVPTQTGQVFLFNGEDGQQWGSPFQPPLTPGTAYPWQAPAVYGSGADAQLVLSDGRQKVYLLSRAVSPQPHLMASEEVDISTSPLNTRFAIVGDLALAGTQDGNVAVFGLPSLAPKPSTDIQSQIAWGPFSVGSHVVLATATDELVCLDDQAQVAWRKPLTHGSPAGRPIEHNGDLVMLWSQGGLSRIPLADGNEIAFVPLPQPTVAGPVLFGQRLVVSAYDGTLLIVESP